MEPEGSLAHSQLSLSWASSIHSMPPHPISWRSILILSTHLGLGLTIFLFPLCFATISLYAPLLRIIYISRPTHSSWFDYTNITWWAVQIIQLHVRQFSLLNSYLVPLIPKYPPQHPILKHPQSTFLPQCERPCFTPIQNNGQYYSSIYLDL